VIINIIGGRIMIKRGWEGICGVKGVMEGVNGIM
jgi:hypothetical protein